MSDFDFLNVSVERQGLHLHNLTIGGHGLLANVYFGRGSACPNATQYMSAQNLTQSTAEPIHFGMPCSSEEDADVYTIAVIADELFGPWPDRPGRPVKCLGTCLATQFTPLHGSACAAPAVAA